MEKRRRRLVNAATGKELLAMFGRGGMRILVGPIPSIVSNVSTSSACNIALDQTAKLGGNSILRTHVDFAMGERFEEIVEVDRAELAIGRTVSDLPHPDQIYRCRIHNPLRQFLV